MLEQSLPVLERYMYLPQYTEEYHVPLYRVPDGSIFSSEDIASLVPQVVAVYTLADFNNPRETVSSNGKLVLYWKYEYRGVYIR